MRHRDPSIRLAADWDGLPRMESIQRQRRAALGLTVTQHMGSAPFVVTLGELRVETWEPERVLAYLDATHGQRPRWHAEATR